MNNHVIDRHREPDTHHTHDTCCPEIPELRRLQYFYGQMLSSADLQEEQRYFREKLRLLNRCVHGYGVLCGLRVVPVPVDEYCDPQTDREREWADRELRDCEAKVAAIRERLQQATSEEEKRRLEEEMKKLEAECEKLRRRVEELCPPAPGQPPSARVAIECGIAIDCHGNEIVVRRAKTIDLFHYLDPSDSKRTPNGRRPLWVSICFCESPVDPVRPVHTDPCQPADACRYAKVQESYRITVTDEPPQRDARCDTCCCGCGDACLVLARIDPFVPNRAIPEAAIHNDVRRRFGLYDWVSVTGISWVHDGDYTANDAAALLGQHGQGNGLEVRFSRNVRSETLRRGVIDVTVIEGGRGRAGDIYHVPGEIHHPAGALVDRVYFRQTSDDKFHEGDLLRVRLRADFVLDECCRAVDGNHIGGRVPLLPGSTGVTHPAPHRHDCLEPPNWDGPWTSGNGSGGGLFESWFGIGEYPSGGDKKGEVK